jgi:hypothetical protein
MLLQRFDVDLDDDRPVTPVSIITTMPDIEPWFRVTALPRTSRSTDRR